MSHRWVPWLLALALLGGAGCHDRLPDARDRLEHSQFVAERVGAARALGRIGGPEAIRVLALTGLHDSSAKVRVASVVALSHLHDKHLADLFEDLFTDPSPKVQIAAATALGVQGTPKALAYLELAYARVDGPARDAVAKALAAHPGAPSKAVADAATRRLDRLLKAMDSPSQAEQIGAAEEVGRSGRPAAVRTLLPLLASPSISVAAAAARGLGDAGDQKAVAPLIRVLGETYPALRRATADALGALGDPTAIPALQKAALDGGEASALEAVAAIERLGNRAPKAAGAALCTVAAKATVGPVAAAAAQGDVSLGAPCDLTKPVTKALARGGAAALPALAVVRVVGKAALTKAADESLATLVADPDPQVAAAAWAAAGAGDVKTLAGPSLAALSRLEAADTAARQEWVARPLPTRPGWGGASAAPADDDDDGVAAADAKRYDKRFDQLMHKVATYRARLEAKRRKEMGLAAVDGGVLAQKALAGLTDDAPLPRIELVPDGPPHLEALLSAVAVAAGRLAGDQALPGLRPLLRHPDPAVRASALIALGHVPGEAATELLANALVPTAPPQVVAAAAKALAARRAGGPALVRIAPNAPAEALPAVAEALGALGGTKPEAALVGLLEGPAAGAAAKALGKIGGDAAAAALARLVAEPDPAGEVSAIDALSGMGRKTQAVAGALGHALHSRRPEVRVAAARALGRLGIADPWLEALTKDYDHRVRVAAAAAAKGS